MYGNKDQHLMRFTNGELNDIIDSIHANDF